MRRVEGVTLTELILVIVILGILAAFVGPVLYNAMRAYDRAQVSSATHGELRYAMERMSREIREIRRNSTNAILLDVAPMTQSTLGFFRNDGTQVLISRTSSFVNMSYVPPGGSTLTGLLLDQVNGFSLAYFQPNATAVAASTSSLAFIQVSVSLVDSVGGTFAARQRIDLRDPQ